MENKELKHHYDSTVGLWATDRPDLIPEELKEYFFKLEKVDEGIPKGTFRYKTIGEALKNL